MLTTVFTEEFTDSYCGIVRKKVDRGCNVNFSPTMSVLSCKNQMFRSKQIAHD